MVLMLDKEAPVLALVAAAAMLEASQVYYIKDDISMTIGASPPVPPHVIGREQLPYPSCFFSYEGQALRFTDDLHQDVGTCDWILVNHTAHGMTMTHVMDQKGSFKFMQLSVPYGVRYPEGIEDEKLLQATTFLLKLLAFINSPFVDISRHGIPRGLRRRVLEGAAPAPQHETSVVTLRRHQQRAKPAGDGQSVEWQHQWWVSGHYRAQWYASQQAHKVIWIAPFMKGPDGKPVLQKTYAVVR